MSARSTTDMVRYLVFTAHKVRHASTTSLPRPKKPVKPEHGQQIFVYNHLQTNQVVYSLTKTMKNNDALSQLPFNGKKTVPRALRKDLWMPLATISFPPGHGPLGLSTYQKLRELRKLHETFWDPAQMVQHVHYTDGSVKRENLSRKERGRKLMDQKANSVADMAFVLGEIGSGRGEQIGLSKGLNFGRWEEKEEVGVEKGEDGKEKRVVRKKWVEELGEKVLVEVRWRDLGDAEFAKTWKGNIIHDVLERGNVENRYGDAIEAAETARRVEERLAAQAAAKEGKTQEVTA